jgi:uncharacterized protein
VEFYTIPITDTAGPQKYILFRPLLGLALVGNQALIDLVRDNSRELRSDSTDAVTFLRKAGFFEPDPTPPTSANDPYQPTIGVLLLTNQCQLRCVYCYAGAGDLPTQELSFELGRAVIDEVCKNAQETGQTQFSISFHGGGEPTKAWKVMKKCTEYARQKPITSSISLTSNGIWSARQTDWIVANLNGISLSIDGAPDTQNRQRPLREGGGSSKLSMHSAAELDQRSFPYGIRMTATAPWSNLPDDVRYLVENTSCQSLQVEPAFNTGRVGHGRPGDEDSAEFIDAVLEAYDVAQKAGRKFHYAGSRLGWVSDVFCTAPYNALIVNPTGDLVACYEVTDHDHPLIHLSTFGRVENGEIKVDVEARQRLHSLMAERRAACKECFCYWSCAGNCYTRAFIPGETGHQLRDNLCVISRTLTEKLLLRKIAENGGVWQNHPSQQPAVTWVQVV